MRRSSNNELIILSLYVNDLLIIDISDKEIGDFKLDLTNKFDIADLDHISYFLGVQFYNSRGLLMHPRRYASEILKRFEMEHYNSTLTPTGPRFQLAKGSDKG